MNQNFNGNNFGQQQGFQQTQQTQPGFQQQQPQQQFQQPQQQFQQQGGGMFVDGNQAPSAGNGTLPKGHYPVRVTNAEYKENNNQTGWILALENTVMAGVFAGRKIFDNYNMQHQNETAQNIGQANYAKLCQSVFGNPQNRPQNPAALIGAEYVIDYGAQRKKKSTNNTYQPEADENEEVTMEVKDRLPVSAYNAAAHQPQPQQQVMSQQAFPQQQQQPQQQPAFGHQQAQQAQPVFQQQAQPQQQLQQQQPQGQGFQQQQLNVPDAAQAGAGNQQGATLQGSPGQGQNGNGQGNGAPQGDNSANANPGNVNQTPFNQGAGNGFGGGFGQM